MDTKITIVNTKDEHTVFVACNARSNGSICICISIECHRLHTHKKKSTISIQDHAGRNGRRANWLHFVQSYFNHLFESFPIH